MKNQILAVALLICCSGIHCGQTGAVSTLPEPRQKNGSVRVDLHQNDLPSSVSVIEAILERPGFRPITQSLKIQNDAETLRFRFDQVPVGSWSLTVQAMNRSSLILYRGEATVSVLGSQTTETSVFMRRATLGSIEVSLLWGQKNVKWQMHPGSPVLQQTPDSWDSDHYYFDDPVVLKINDVYHMWYSSATIDRSDEESYWIAYATSPDGIKWTKHGAVISPGPPGSWMDMGADSPSVIYEDGVFKMWFVGAQHFQKYRNGIGYATSTDGKTWDVERQPVVPPSQSMPMAWNTCVIKKDGLWYHFVAVSSIGPSYPTDVVLLTSVDGKIWSERGKVLSARKEIPWQKAGIVPGQVIYDENRFKMFYTAFSENTLSMSIGYAESTDGLNWSNSSNLPTLSLSDTPSWVTNGVGFPAVIRDQGKLKIWYSGLADRSHGYHIGYAEQTE